MTDNSVARGSFFWQHCAGLGGHIMRLMPFISAALVLFISGPSFAQEWIEFASREDRFTCLFPNQPKITETIYRSEYGADLPARVYGVTQAQSRYSITVVDYNQARRILTDKSKTCPAGDVVCGLREGE